MNICFTFDVEQDLHSDTYKSLSKGLPSILKILNKNEIKSTFFVPAKLLDKFPELFINLQIKGHEIALHGYAHERFDNLPLEEKKIKIENSIKIYKKIFKKNANGFRAPQHSIDEETLSILHKNNFLYDSSHTPFNLLQLVFFPKIFLFGLKGFFKKRNMSKINKNFYEIPISSVLIPFVSLPLRIFPKFLLRFYLFLLGLTNKSLVFYAHSWDFIELPESKIDRYFSHKKLITNLDYIISCLSKRNKFVTCKQLVNEFKKTTENT